MSRKVLLLITVVVVAAAFVPESSAAPARRQRTERTIQLDYRCPCGPRAGSMAWGSMLFGTGGVSFATEDREKYVTIRIADRTGGTVAAKIAVDSIPGNLEYEHEEYVCGGTDDPLEITPAAEVDVYLYSGTCADMSTASTPTMGTVTLTLSNLP